MDEENSENLSLAAEFAEATRERWLELVEATLKGAPFASRLVARSRDGIAIGPLYARAAPTSAPLARAPGTPWQIMQRIEHPDADAANAQALNDLENGASGLTLVGAGGIGGRGYGLDPSAAALARTLCGVHLDANIGIDFDIGQASADMPAHFAALVGAGGLDPTRIDARFGLDPLGAMARAGASHAPWRDIAPRFAEQIARLAQGGWRGPFAVADGRVIHDAGGSEVQELAWVISVAVAYLRALAAGGIALDGAGGPIYFRLAADSDAFLGIAKLRALRRLWARVEAASGLPARPAFLAAEVAWRMMTRRNPWANMLRATMAVFAAGVGGADAISVLAFTSALGLPDGFARRIARNTQLMLIEEANLARVADPAAGAGSFEDLTAQLCVAAWKAFQDIERAGGAFAALEQGRVQDGVAATRAERQQALARRRDALIGTSEFPDLHERAVAVLDVAPVIPRPLAAAFRFAPLPALRLAEPFEELRAACEHILARDGARPRVFLANLGTPSQFTARASFARNFFAAGGIECLDNDGFASRAGMLAAWRNSGARLACLCSTDEVYADEAAEAAGALRSAAAAHIYLAGRPGEREAALRDAGVGEFIYAGSDALAILRAAHDILARA
ncbi:MAG: methylmalonyl-CoA mutase subunit beta [Proteobacteria bacterium]|nr:methylmalonyl-CoA mutase subunit beta [Pseudomonadota bacterium]